MSLTDTQQYLEHKPTGTTGTSPQKRLAQTARQAAGNHWQKSLEIKKASCRNPKQVSGKRCKITVWRRQDEYSLMLEWRQAPSAGNRLCKLFAS